MLLQTIQDICKQNGTNINEVERMLGLGRGSIYKWGNSSPSIGNIQKVADYFRVSIDFLLGRVVEQKTNDGENSAKLHSMIGTLLSSVNESISKGEMPNPGILDSLRILSELTVYKLDK